LLSVFEQVREGSTSFNGCIDHMIERGWIYSMGRIKQVGPEIFELTDEGLEACARSIFAAESLRGRRKRKLRR
jgi:chromosome segregation and condensation protein ScpB